MDALGRAVQPRWFWLPVLVSIASAGCGGRGRTESEASTSAQTASAELQTPAHPSSVSLDAEDDRPSRADADLSEGPDVESVGRQTNDASAGDETQPKNTAKLTQPPTWDDAYLASAGIRKLAGKYLTLFTDLPPHPAVDQLPAIFDQAIPQWCEYFELSPAAVESWRTNGYLIRDEARFRQAGMFPDDLPVFLNGFQRGNELWLYEQPSDYYRRHLLLHEGTHGFMKWALGGTGPPWYMEGAAELLATHRWVDGELTLRYFPRDKEEVLLWGRIKKIRDEVKQNRGRTLKQIMRYDVAAHLEVAPYAWCWAAAAFFDNHPACRQPFRELRNSAFDSSPRFSAKLYQRIASQWPHLMRQWQLFVLNMEYGYDLGREAIEPRPIVDLPRAGATVKVVADRGWQSTGFRLEQGQVYRLEASGRFQIARDSQIWWCESNGITLRYHGGLPLGILLAAVDDEDQPVSGITRLAVPESIGHGADLTTQRAGTLYLRVNDSPAELADNAGELTVRIK